MTCCLLSQLEALEAVSDAFEVVAFEGSDRLRDDAVSEANRRLKEDGCPFEFYVMGYRVFVRKLR